MSNTAPQPMEGAEAEVAQLRCEVCLHCDSPCQNTLAPERQGFRRLRFPYPFQYYRSFAKGRCALSWILFPTFNHPPQPPLQLELERRRSSQFADELQQAKEQRLATQKAYEEEEEFITNRLLGRLEKLKSERAALVQEVEAEEDFLVNTLYRRLSQVQKEKTDVEAKLLSEHDTAAMLQRRLNALAEERQRLVREKADLENTLEAEQEYISLKLTKQAEKLAAEKAALARERSELQRQVADLSAAVEQSRKEKAALEAALEAEEEAVVNRLQRQLQQVTTAYRALEARMESAGMSPRADGAPAIDGMVDWCYGRSPSRNSDRMMSRGRERSVSVSSTSSMRDASHMSGGLPDHGGHAVHAVHVAAQGQFPYHPQSASSSPSHRRRAEANAQAPALVDAMQTQPA